MNSIISQKDLVPSEVYTDEGFDKIYQEARAKLDSFIPDLSTDKSRKEIASFSHLFTKSKTGLLSLGDELDKDLKQQAQNIESKRKVIRNFKSNISEKFDELKKIARQPLTEWEEEEEKKKQVGRDAVSFFSEKAILNTINMKSDDIEKHIEEVHGLYIDFSYVPNSFHAEIETKKETALLYLNNQLEAKKKNEEEQEELEQLRKERAELEAQKAEFEAQKAEQVRLKELEEAKKKAEQEAYERAKIEQEERQRKDQNEALERAKNAENVKRVETEVYLDLMQGIGEENARKAVDLIKSNLVRNVKISY